jgi:site-specific recombinase XerC
LSIPVYTFRIDEIFSAAIYTDRIETRLFAVVHEIRDRAMFTLTLAPGASAGVLNCGLRIGEVAAFEMTDLHLGEVPPRLIIHGKGSEERTVYLSIEAGQALQAWLAQRPTARDRHVFRPNLASQTA